MHIFYSTIDFLSLLLAIVDLRIKTNVESICNNMYIQKATKFIHGRILKHSINNRHVFLKWTDVLISNFHWTTVSFFLSFFPSNVSLKSSSFTSARFIPLMKRPTTD